MSNISLFSDRVMRAHSDFEVAPHLIRIDAGLISSVEPMTRAEAVDQDGVMDLGDRLVTPTFINGHTHLSMSAFRGIGVDAMAGNIVEDLYFKLESALSGDDVYAFAKMAAYDSLLSGVGTVWDHYYYADAVARALQDVGLTGVVAPTLQDQAGPGVEVLEAQLDITRTMATDDSLRAAGIIPALGPHATDTVSDRLWTRICDLSNQLGLPVHTHASQSIEEYGRSVKLYNRSPIRRLKDLGVLDLPAKTLLVHGLFVPQDDLDLLNPDLNVLGYCPFSQIQFCFPAAINAWHAAGISFTVGTDCGACNDTMNVQQELRVIASGRAFGIPQSQAGQTFIEDGFMDSAVALESERQRSRATQDELRDPQTLLGSVWGVPGSLTEDLKVGQLSPGYRANIAVWDLNHPACWPGTDPLRTLTMSDATKALHGVMVNGQWRGDLGAFQGSILKSPEYEESRQEASRRLDDLRRRIGI